MTPWVPDQSSLPHPLGPAVPNRHNLVTRGNLKAVPFSGAACLLAVWEISLKKVAADCSELLNQVETAFCTLSGC